VVPEGFLEKQGQRKSRTRRGEPEGTKKQHSLDKGEWRGGNALAFREKRGTIEKTA